MVIGYGPHPAVAVLAPRGLKPTRPSCRFGARKRSFHLAPSTRLAQDVAGPLPHPHLWGRRQNAKCEMRNAKCKMQNENRAGAHCGNETAIDPPPEGDLQSVKPVVNVLHHAFLSPFALQIVHFAACNLGLRKLICSAPAGRVCGHGDLHRSTSATSTRVPFFNFAFCILQFSFCIFRSVRKL
jgi:hypothetical protein